MNSGELYFQLEPEILEIRYFFTTVESIYEVSRYF